jgi:hypothetical protein
MQSDLFEEVQVPGDGDCFYYALLVAVGVLNETTLWEEHKRKASSRAKVAAKKLRNLFLQALERPTVKNHFRQYDTELHDLRQRLSENQYAEDAEVKLAAVLFRLRLHVYLPDNRKDIQWGTVAPDAPIKYGDALGLHRCHRSDVVMMLRQKHYTPLRWTDENCLQRLHTHFLGRMHRLSAGVHCTAALSGLRDAYQGVRRCDNTNSHPDVVRNFLETRHEALLDLRRLRKALRGSSARDAGFRETLEGLCKDLERPRGPVSKDVAHFLELLELRLRLIAVAAQEC